MIEIDERLAKAINSVNQKQFEAELEMLRKISTEKGPAAGIFNLKEKILGKKSVSSEAVSIIDPDTGILVNDHEEIKSISLKYCQLLLTNRPPNPGFEEIYQAKIELHKQRVKEKISDDYEELDYEMFAKALVSVSRKPGNKYSFITEWEIT